MFVLKRLKRSNMFRS